MFKKMRGIKLDYYKQGLIYFVCRNYTFQSEMVKNRVLSLCESIGKEYSKALFEMVTMHHSVQRIAIRYYTSTSNLYRLRKKFYESWFTYENSTTN